MSVLRQRRYLLAEDRFELIDIFEQRHSFGGAWNYSSANQHDNLNIPQTDPTPPLDEPIWRSDEATFVTPMYDQLETNIPHVLMKYSDAASLQDDQLFPSRQKVLDYLENYANEVKHLVHFQTQVIDIRLKDEGCQDTWLVTTKSLISDSTFRREYDAVVTANGHYNVPMLPDVKGIREWNQVNQGVISHSKFFRKPDTFADQKIIVVGNSASGVDIASKLGTVARHPILVSQRSDSPVAFPASYKEIVCEIAEFLPSSLGKRAVRFADGRVETDIDAILFCTGYFYSFPFLSSLRPDLIETGERVQHLYQHLFYINNPTLAFVGLPAQIIPFRTFEGQAAVISRVWSDRLSLPSRNVMETWEQTLIVERGVGKPFHVLPFPKDFEYHNSMVEWALCARNPNHGKLPPKWSGKETWMRERFKAIKLAFAEMGEDRHSVKTLEQLGFDYDSWISEGESHKGVL